MVEIEKKTQLKTKNATTKKNINQRKLNKDMILQKHLVVHNNIYYLCNVMLCQGH